MDVQLIRLHKGNDCTRGVLTLDDRPICLTYELPWLDNKPHISCIPDGEYEAHWTYSQKFKKTSYLLKGVPGRTGIRIHAGNWLKDTTGCILVGFDFEIDMDGLPYISQSSSAIMTLNIALNNIKAFLLRIKSA